VAATALVLLATRPANLTLTLILYSLATAGIAAYLGPFWAHTSGQLRGLAAAAATGSINAVGSVGGFAGPYIVGALNTHTGTPKAGVAYLTTCAALSGLLLLLPVSGGKRRSAR
jgi:MFS transporter, ACS family, tartrate transporter